jgi:hypothetical protein
MLPDWICIVALTLEHWVLLFLFGFAAAIRLARVGIEDAALLGCAALAGTGLGGWLAFWVWFASPSWGRRFSFAITAAVLAYAIWSWRQLTPCARTGVRNLLPPALLVCFVSLFMLAWGFLYGGFQKPLDTAAERFSHPLPSDNSLPFLLAEQMLNGHIEHPMYIDWLSSDRPPLQAGMTLLQAPFTPKPRVHAYTVLSVLLQSLCLFGLWIFLHAFDLPPRARALALAVTGCSGFFIVNSFFTWPKLLAAAFELGFAGLMLSPKLLQIVRQRAAVAMAAGALLGLSLLSHGGAIFAVVAIVITMALLRQTLPGSRWLALAGAFALTYGPWMLYQKYVDPPGDRLLKMHLAGVEKVTSQPFSTVLETAYKRIGWKGAWEARKVNMWAIFADEGVYWREVKQLFLSPGKSAPERAIRAGVASDLRGRQFFFFAQSLGLLVCGPLFLLNGVRRKNNRSNTWFAASLCWLLVVGTLLVWCLVMFVPRSTVNHQGAYLANILAFSGAILAIWAVSPLVAVVVASMQIAFTCFLYGFWMTPLPSDLHASPERSMAILAVAACLLVGLTLAQEAGVLRFARTRPRKVPVISGTRNQSES